MATPIGVDVVTSISRRFILPDIADNVYNSNPLFFRLNKMNKKRNACPNKHGQPRKGETSSLKRALYAQGAFNLLITFGMRPLCKAGVRSGGSKQHRPTHGVILINWCPFHSANENGEATKEMPTLRYGSSRTEKNSVRVRKRAHTYALLLII